MGEKGEGSGGDGGGKWGEWGRELGMWYPPCPPPHRQWKSSENGRTLFRYKPKVTDRSQIDYPNTISYRNIAKLRLGYNQLRDYQFKLGISNNNLCECNQLETVEHYLLHCERYFNERKALRTHIFNTTGTPDLLCKFFISCTKNDFRKIHEMNIFSALGDFITRTASF